MLPIKSFIECITTNLADRGFGKERINQIVDQFKARQEFHVSNGKLSTDAYAMAMRDTFDRISKEAIEKAKRTAATLSTHAEHVAAITEGLNVDVKLMTMKDLKGNQVGPRGSRGTAIAMAAVSRLEKNPGFTKLSYTNHYDNEVGYLFKLLGPEFDSIATGMLGRQKGKVHVENIPAEMFRKGSTGDKTAEALADAWSNVGDVIVSRTNEVGGSMNRLERYMPQPFNNVTKLLRAGQKDFVEKHLDRSTIRIDWNKTRHPDGSPIEDRAKFLSDIYETKSSDGVNKIDPNSYRGQGRAMGNMLDNHRLLHYEDAASWSKALELYGDGNPFDVMVRHIQSAAHKIAAIRTFGPNPDLAAKNMLSMAKGIAHEAGLRGQEITDLESVFKNKFDPMFRQVMHHNPMNPDSKIGAIVTGANNLSGAALMGSAVLASTLGDFTTSAIMRKANGMPMAEGAGLMLRTLALNPTEMRHAQLSMGYIADGYARATSAIERWNPMNSMGPEATRRIADTVIRASGMNYLTNLQRWAFVTEQTGMFKMFKDKKYDELPFVQVLKRYGITQKEWDTFRTEVKPHTEANGFTHIRPIDALNIKSKDAQTIYSKFQAMVNQESYHAVPKASIEASVALRGDTRPDTMLGVVASSFAMFRNFPITYANQMARLGLQHESVKTRIGFYAATAAVTTMAGIMAVQIGELTKGRDALDWSDPRLWAKGFMKGGGAGVFGDFLFADTGEYGRTLSETVAGPTLGLAGDVTALAFGDVFGMANAMIKDGDLSNFDSKTGERAVKLARTYTPGSNLFYSGTVLQRLFWDRIEDIVDPKAQRKRDTKMKKWQEDHGNRYYWPLGSGSPERGPLFGGD